KEEILKMKPTSNTFSLPIEADDDRLPLRRRLPLLRTRRRGNRNIDLSHRSERCKRLVELASIANHQDCKLIFVQIFWRYARNVGNLHLFYSGSVLFQKIGRIPIKLIRHALAQHLFWC